MSTIYQSTPKQLELAHQIILELQEESNTLSKHLTQNEIVRLKAVIQYSGGYTHYNYIYQLAWLINEGVSPQDIEVLKQFTYRIKNHKLFVEDHPQVEDRHILGLFTTIFGDNRFNVNLEQVKKEMNGEDDRFKMYGVDNSYYYNKWLHNTDEQDTPETRQFYSGLLLKLRYFTNTEF